MMYLPVSQSLLSCYVYRAAFANAPSGLIPASFLIMLMGVIFGYYFLLIVSTVQQHTIDDYMVGSNDEHAIHCFILLCI